MIFVPVPALAGLFFFSSWLTMIFGGIIAPKAGLQTISYPLAMLVTIALWLVMAPAILFLRRGPSPGRWGRSVWRY